jgi:hypothetical protein
VIDGVRTRDLGEHWLKDLSCPLRLHHVVADGLATSRWPLRTPAGHSNTLTHAIPSRRPGYYLGHRCAALLHAEHLVESLAADSVLRRRPRGSRSPLGRDAARP